MPTVPEQTPIPPPVPVKEFPIIDKQSELDATVQNIRQEGIPEAQKPAHIEGDNSELEHRLAYFMNEVNGMSDDKRIDIGSGFREDQQEEPPVQTKPQTRRSLIQNIVAGFEGTAAGIADLFSRTTEETKIRLQRTTPPRFTESQKFLTKAIARAEERGEQLQETHDQKPAPPPAQPTSAVAENPQIATPAEVPVTPSETPTLTAPTPTLPSAEQTPAPSNIVQLQSPAAQITQPKPHRQSRRPKNSSRPK